MNITDFDPFLSEIEDLEDAFCLDQTIRTGSDHGLYHYKKDRERILISSDYSEDTLVLSTEKAKVFFLDLLEQRYSEDGMPLSLYYEMKSQMEKGD